MAYTSSKIGVEVGRRLQACSTQLAHVQRPAVEKAALIMTTAARAALPARMRNVGKGAKIGARFDIKGVNNPTALIRATGPVHLLERDTHPHLIFRKTARARGKGSTQANRATAWTQRTGQGGYRGGSLKFSDGGYRKEVRHPGTRGKHLFGKAIERSMPEAKKALQSAASAAVIRGFKGLA